MQTREIPRTEWRSFFDAFNRQHEGWLATLEVFSSEIGAQEQAHELPLEGVTVSQTGPAEEIAISLGRSPDEHISHTIAEPIHVWVERTTEGANAALEVESKDQSNKTLLTFRAAVKPELVDGLVS
jgi:hypothetical protein